MPMAPTRRHASEQQEEGVEVVLDVALEQARIGGRGDFHKVGVFGLSADPALGRNQVDSSQLGLDLYGPGSGQAPVFACGSLRDDHRVEQGGLPRDT